MRLLISGGGTGGHVYPALAVVEQLRINAQTAAPAQGNPALLWLGSRTGIEHPLVQDAGIPFHDIQGGALRGRNPFMASRNLAKMLAGISQSLQILEDFRPQACFATGGYVMAPVAIACRMRSVPVMIYLPDMTPGLAVRWLSRLAQRVAVSFPEVAGFFGPKAVVTGYPVRADLLKATEDLRFADATDGPLAKRQTRRAARQRLTRKLGLDLEDGLPLLLVFGGSQGARTINRAVWQAAPTLLPACQILHVIGTRDWPLLEKEGPPLWDSPLAYRYHPVAYLHEEMAWALASADLAVARAGASVLAEFPLARLPSVLAPLPGAGSHQRPNAQKLAESGGTIIIEDGQLAERLEPTIAALLADKSRRLAMGAAVGALARPQAADNIARELQRLVAHGDGPPAAGVVDCDY